MVGIIMVGIMVVGIIIIIIIVRCFFGGAGTLIKEYIPKSSLKGSLKGSRRVL